MTTTTFSFWIYTALILILIWHRTSAAGVIASMVVGAITAVVWRETLHDYLYELVPAFLLAFLAIWLVSLACPERTLTGDRLN